MAPTNYIHKDVRNTPGCQSATWTLNNTVNNTLSAITRKEHDYQKRLMQLQQKGVDISSFQPAFLYWTHLSCAFWLPQVQYQKKKPISVKQILRSNSTPCKVCGSAAGLLFQCSHEDITDVSQLENFLDVKSSGQTCKSLVHV
jgi:hypothetical protein